MVTRCWSNFDHHLGLVHNSWRCCNLQWRADPGDGLARSYPCFIAVVHWHFLAPAFEPSQVNSKSSAWPLINNCCPQERIWQRMPDEGFVRFGATVIAMRAESNNSQPAARERV